MSAQTEKTSSKPRTKSINFIHVARNYNKELGIEKKNIIKQFYFIVFYIYTSIDSSGGSELNARSNKALMFLSSFKRDKKSAYLQIWKKKK